MVFVVNTGIFVEPTNTIEDLPVGNALSKFIPGSISCTGGSYIALDPFNGQYLHSIIINFDKCQTKTGFNTIKNNLDIDTNRKFILFDNNKILRYDGLANNLNDNIMILDKYVEESNVFNYKLKYNNKYIYYTIDKCSKTQQILLNQNIEDILNNNNWNVMCDGYWTYYNGGILYISYKKFIMLLVQSTFKNWWDCTELKQFSKYII